MTSQLKAVSAYLERQPGQPGKRKAPDMLPMSLEDLDRAQRWLAGTASPNPGDLYTEADVCRQTLAKILEFQRVSTIRRGAAGVMKKPWLEGMEVISQPVSAWGGWIETFGLTADVLAASFVTQQNDPFRLGGSFPVANTRPCSPDCATVSFMVLQAPWRYWRRWECRSINNGK